MTTTTTASGYVPASRWDRQRWATWRAVLALLRLPADTAPRWLREDRA